MNKRIVSVIRKLSEAELGKVGGKEDDLDGGDGDPYTDPEQAAEFVKLTGVPDETVKECVKSGICKVNYATGCGKDAAPFYMQKYAEKTSGGRLSIRTRKLKCI